MVDILDQGAMRALLQNLAERQPPPLLDIWKQPQAEGHAWQAQPHYCGKCKHMPNVVEELCCAGGQDNCFYLVAGNNFHQVTFPMPIYWVGSQIFHSEPNICKVELFPYPPLNVIKHHQGCSYTGRPCPALGITARYYPMSKQY